MQQPTSTQSMYTSRPIHPTVGHAHHHYGHYYYKLQDTNKSPVYPPLLSHPCPIYQKYNSLVSFALCSTGQVGHLNLLLGFMILAILFRQMTCPHLRSIGGLSWLACSLWYMGQYTHTHSHSHTHACHKWIIIIIHDQLNVGWKYPFQYPQKIPLAYTIQCPSLLPCDRTREDAVILHGWPQVDLSW